MKSVSYFYINTFCSTCAVPNMAVFCTSFMPWFSVTLLMYVFSEWFWDGFSRPSYYWPHFVVKFHTRYDAIVFGLFVITLLTPVNKHVSLLKLLSLHYMVSLQQIHSLFESEFSTENELALPLSIFQYFLVSLTSSTVNYVFFLVFSPFIYFLSNVF